MFTQYIYQCLHSISTIDICISVIEDVYSAAEVFDLDVDGSSLFSFLCFVGCCSIYFVNCLFPLDNAGW